jgi:hypothetical protein
VSAHLLLKAFSAGSATLNEGRAREHTFGPVALGPNAGSSTILFTFPAAAQARQGASVCAVLFGAFATFLSPLNTFRGLAGALLRWLDALTKHQPRYLGNE